MGLFGPAPRVPDTIPARQWGKVTRGEPKGAVRADPPGDRAHGDVLRRVTAWSAAGRQADRN